MRLASILFFAFLSVSAFGQDKQPDIKFILGEPRDVWERVTTLGDSVLDVNTSTVSWPGENIGQVRFRYIFNKSQVLEGTKVKYKVQALVIEFDCKGRRWRTSQVHYLDSDDKIVDSQYADAAAKWKVISPGVSGGAQITSAGCRVISANSDGAIKLVPGAPPAPATSQPDGNPTLNRRQTGKPDTLQ
jgi:hypothetical protein